MEPTPTPDRSSSRPPSPLGDLLAGSLRPYLVVAGFLAVMWVGELIDLVPGTDLDRFGIRPRRLGGLDGIVLAPFLHAGFGHLLANTLPFALLGSAIASGGIGRFLKVTAIVGLCSGLGVWLFAASGTVTVGASGLVFGFLTYLVARGVFARHLLWLVGGALALLVYGGILWGLLPRPGISWTGHLFGAIGGVAAAWLLHARPNLAEDATRPVGPLGSP